MPRLGIDAASHDGQVESLAVHLEAMQNRLVWTGSGIGSRWLQGGSIPIPDVFTMQKSYMRPDLTAYEVKAYIGDLRGDIREGKYRRYFEISNRLFFAYQSGLCAPAEVPPECGIITYNPAKRVWSVQRAAPPRECSLERVEWQSLLFGLKERRSYLRRLSDRFADEENATLLERARKLGYDICEKLRRASGQDEREAAEVMEVVREIFGEKGSDYDVKGLLLSLKSFQEHRQTAAKAAACIASLVQGLEPGKAWGRKAVAEFAAAEGEERRE